MSNRNAAIQVIKRLRSEGFEALLAGGCVRDMLLGRSAKDYDVATSARPGEVSKLFRRSLKIGAKFGVVIVLVDDMQVEVATFRVEGKYEDGRHPKEVEFATAKEDASRRDFTINGMFYDPVSKEVIDYVGGRGDIEKKIIRTIGDARVRFGEDYLRMLRAVRFSAQLGFAIEKKTWAAVCETAGKIKKISGERIAMELEVTLTDPNRADGAAKLFDSGLSTAIFPKLSAGQAEFGVKVLGHLRKKVGFALAVAAFFADCPVDFAVEKLELLKLSRKMNRHVEFLLENRGRLLAADMSLAELKMLASEPYYDDLYELQRAVQKSKGQSLGALVKVKKRVNALAGEILRPKPLLNGHELIALGARPGPQVGQLAQEVYIAQLEGDLTDADEAKGWVEKWLSRRESVE